MGLRFVIKFVQRALVIVLCSVSFAAVADDGTSRAQNADQWRYVHDSLTNSIAVEQGSLPTQEKIIKYIVVPCAVFALLCVPRTFTSGFGWVGDIQRKESYIADTLQTFLKQRVGTPIRQYSNDHIIENDTMYFTLPSAIAAFGTACAIGGAYFALHGSIGATYSVIVGSRKRVALKNVLAEWCAQRNRIPSSLHALVAQLHDDAQANRLSVDCSNKAIALLLAMGYEQTGVKQSTPILTQKM